MRVLYKATTHLIPFIRFAKHTHAHTHKQDLIISYFSKRRGLVSEQYTDTVTTQKGTLHNVKLKRIIVVCDY